MIDTYTTGSGQNIIWWLVSKKAICDICQKPIQQTAAILIYYWDKAGEHERTLCHHACKSKAKKTPHTIQADILPVYLSDMKPPKAVPRVVTPHDLKDVKGDITIFDVDKIKSVRTTDNTRLAGRESFEGAQIGAPVEEVIAELDEPVKDVDKALEDLR